MFISEVFPQPLGPTTATNSPSETDMLMSTRAGISRASRSNQYRFETRSMSSLAGCFIPAKLPHRLFRSILLFGLHSGTEQFFEESLFHKAVDNAVVHDRLEVNGPRLRRLLFGRLCHHRLHGGSQHVRNALEGLVFCVQVVNTFHIFR